MWNVLIWYHWGQEEAKCIDTISSSLAFLKLPIHVLQNATTFIPRCKPCTPPALPVQVENESSFSHGDSTYTSEAVDLDRADMAHAWMRDAHIKSQPWKIFFDSQKTAYDSYLQTETPQQKMTWLNHE